MHTSKDWSVRNRTAGGRFCTPVYLLNNINSFDSMLFYTGICSVGFTKDMYFKLLIVSKHV
jgi:hypothetical protein